MSVLMTLRVAGDPDRMEAYAAAHPEVVRRIADRASEHGLRFHRFYGGDGRIMVVDEWDSEDAFRRFFGASPEIGEMMAEVGVTEEPRPEFWRLLDTRDNAGTTIGEARQPA